MLTPAAIARATLASALALAIMLTLGACAPTLPATDPSIRGTITSVTPASDGGSLLVEAPDTPEFEYDRASVRVTGSTVLLRLGEGDMTERIGFGDLAAGQTVDVWFEGPVAESYPVQASAGTLLVRE